MKFFRFAISRTSFLAFGFFLSVGIAAALSAWTPPAKHSLDPLYANDWNTVSYNASGWERSGNITAPGENVFLNTTGRVGIGTANPRAKLEVQNTSNITATSNGLLIQGGGDSDDVGYELKTLDMSGNTDFFIRGDGTIGVGTVNISPGLRIDVEGRVGATEYCDEKGENCIAAKDIGTGSGGLVGIINGGGLEIQNGQIGMKKFPCAENNVMKFQNGNWQCAPDEVSAGGGTTTIHDITCDVNKILKYSAGGWVCAVDETGGGSGYWISATGGIAYNSGRVGIGTTNPSANLEIYGSNGVTALRLTEAEAGQSPSTWELQARQGTDDSFQIHNVDFAQNYITVRKSGKVGIMEDNPSEVLHVNGNVLANSFPTTSDIRLKTDIKPTRGLENILRLRGVEFTWKKDGTKGMGFIAQEVEEVMPDIVHTGKNGYKSVEYQSIIAPLVEAVKEQQEEIEQLQRELRLIRTQLSR